MVGARCNVPLRIKKKYGSKNLSGSFRSTANCFGELVFLFFKETESESLCWHGRSGD